MYCKTGYIYFFKHRDSGKYYIGQTTKTLPVRMKEHLQEAKKSKARCVVGFHSALKFYGKDSFDWGILEEVNLTFSSLDEREIFYIKLYNSRFPNGFNLTVGGHYYPKNGVFSNGFPRGHKKLPGVILNNAAAQKKFSETEVGKTNLLFASTLASYRNRMSGPGEGFYSGKYLTRKYKGVTYSKRFNRWIGQISFDGKSKQSGLFKTAEEAARWFDSESFNVFGFDCYLNFRNDFKKTAWGSEIKSCYLCGSIESAPDGGVGWRDSLTSELEKRKTEILDPCYIEKKEIGNIPNYQKFLYDLKSSGNLKKLSLEMSKIMKRDFLAVSKSDCLIFNMNHDAKNGGTYCEVEFARFNKIPVYGLCLGDLRIENNWVIHAVLQNGAIFKSVEKLLNFLDRGDRSFLGGVF